MKTSVSIIVPCYNEEGNIRATIAAIKEALASVDVWSDYEILIFNDNSADSTGSVAEEIGRNDGKIRVIHNLRNMGFGYNYSEGVRLAGKDYVIMVPGDNEIPAEAVKKVLSLAGRADVVVPYTANARVRPVARRVVSRLFVIAINALFGTGLRYYNGTCLIRSALLKKIPLKTRGFAYMAAILVRLLRSGASFVEVGVDIRQRDAGRTKAFAVRNVLSVLGAIAGLFWDVRVRGRSRYNAPCKRVEADAGNG